MTKRGLVGAWCPSLGATGFRLFDRSGRNNHGTLTNMASTAWTTSGGNKGRVGLSFDGVDDHVNAGNKPAYSFDFSSQFSLSAWIRTTSGSGGIIGKRVVAGWYMSLEASNVLGLVLQGSAGSAIIVNSASSGISDGNWHLVQSVYSGNSNASGISMFVDGLVVSTTTVLNTVSGSLVNSIDLCLGSITTNAFRFTGLLDDIRIYDRALTAPEIRQLYIGGRGFGLLPERPRRRGKAAAAAFKAFRARRQSQLIGGGV